MPEPKLKDLKPAADDFRRDVLDGLHARPPRLPCKYFYDARGARLFEQICELEEYYPTRTEIGILRRHLPAMSKLIGPSARIVEYGSGDGLKTRLLLEALEAPAVYTAVDIAREQLKEAARALQRDFPDLEVLPVCADYSSPLSLPKPSVTFDRTVVFFPGSTIGNFTPNEARRFLRRFAQLAAQGDRPGGLLIGVDRKKDPLILERAYNDARGVTAEFNLNLLQRVNRELGGDFQLEQWRHHASWNARIGAVEIHLVSLCEQHVCIDGTSFHFAEGEAIHTENSFKYHPEEFVALATDAGFIPRGLWSDPRELFSVHYFELK